MRVIALGFRVAVPAGVDLAGPYVELSYVDAVGERQRRPLVDCTTARFGDVGGAAASVAAW
ncbi:hypothetical protein [Streptomyces sp. NPDC051921]|uniref:hypothetical protein n=1 Tax=Streptomyces sp. NPDC051921 TaxID=3155806 RepID=UPI0034261A5E